MEHTPGLESSPPGSDTLKLARSVGAVSQRQKRLAKQPLTTAGTADRSMIGQAPR